MMEMQKPTCFTVCARESIVAITRIGVNQIHTQASILTRFRSTLVDIFQKANNQQFGQTHYIYIYDWLKY